LYNGGTVEFLQKFNAEKVWKRFQDPRQDLTLFMAVPTIYSKLIQYFETLPEEDQSKYKNCFNQFRLMVSGSAALPGPILQKWKNISGHTLLERYGMSEIGMALTNPYKETNSKRLEGHVGFPFPSVQVRIVRPLDADNLPLKQRIIENSDEAGELQIKGPSVFKEYFNRPEATRDTFESDGWFKTGDTASINPETGHYKILGRTSVDIIKTGGYKVSALEIEKTYLESDFVRDIAVLGVEDQEWGERVAAIVSLKDENTSESVLKEWGKKHLAPYKVPTLYILLKPGQEIPKNAMGKINKKSLKKEFFP
jgi:malonyl-CoA/methylmalonyl-CoA synthetase